MIILLALFDPIILIYECNFLILLSGTENHPRPPSTHPPNDQPPFTATSAYTFHKYTHPSRHTRTHFGGTSRAPIRHLRTELLRLRRKGALKTCGGSLDRPNIDMAAEPSVFAPERCARCRVELGKIINRGAPCQACCLRVCKQCREFSTHTMDWVCCVCHKQMWVKL